MGVNVFSSELRVSISALRKLISYVGTRQFQGESLPPSCNKFQTVEISREVQKQAPSSSSTFSLSAQSSFLHDVTVTSAAECARLLTAALDRAIIAFNDDLSIAVLRRGEKFRTPCGRICPLCGSLRTDKPMVPRPDIIMGQEIEQVLVPAECANDTGLRREYRDNGKFEDSDSCCTDSGREGADQIRGEVSNRKHEFGGEFSSEVDRSLFDEGVVENVYEESRIIDRTTVHRTDRTNAVDAKLCALDSRSQRCVFSAQTIGSSSWYPSAVPHKSADRSLREALSCFFTWQLEACAHFMGVDRARLYIPQYEDTSSPFMNSCSGGAGFRAGAAASCGSSGKAKLLRLIVAVPDTERVSVSGGKDINTSNLRNICSLAFNSRVAIVIDDMSDCTGRLCPPSRGRNIPGTAPPPEEAPQSIIAFPITHPLYHDWCVGVIEFSNKLRLHAPGVHTWTKRDEELAFFCATTFSYFLHRYAPLLESITTAASGVRAKGARGVRSATRKREWPVFKPKKVLLNSSLAQHYQPLGASTSTLLCNEEAKSFETRLRTHLFGVRVAHVNRVADLQRLRSKHWIPSSEETNVSQRGTAILDQLVTIPQYIDRLETSCFDLSERNCVLEHRLDTANAQIHESTVKARVLETECEELNRRITLQEADLARVGLGSKSIVSRDKYKLPPGGETEGSVSKDDANNDKLQEFLTSARKAVLILKDQAVSSAGPLAVKMAEKLYSDLRPVSADRS